MVQKVADAQGHLDAPEFPSVTSVTRPRSAFVIQAPVTSAWPIVAIQAPMACSRPVIVTTVMSCAGPVIVKTSLASARSAIVIQTTMARVWPTTIIVTIATVHIQSILDMDERWSFIPVQGCQEGTVRAKSVQRDICITGQAPGQTKMRRTVSRGHMVVRQPGRGQAWMMPRPAPVVSCLRTHIVMRTPTIHIF